MVTTALKSAWCLILHEFFAKSPGGACISAAIAQNGMWSTPFDGWQDRSIVPFHVVPEAFWLERYDISLDFDLGA